MRRFAFYFGAVCLISALLVGCQYVQEYNAHRFDKQIETANKLLRHEEVRLKDLIDLDDKFCTDNRYVRIH
jgi:hypothetical protein